MFKAIIFIVLSLLSAFIAGVDYKKKKWINMIATIIGAIIYAVIAVLYLT